MTYDLEKLRAIIREHAPPGYEIQLSLVPTAVDEPRRSGETEKVPPARVGKNGIDMGERGIYDQRNKLNDMTGREWVYFLRSVETTSYSVSGAESIGHNLRRKHPSPKPPQLMQKIVEFFTKKDGWVLDPFAGVGGTLLGCARCGRRGVGIDLNAEYIDIYRQVCRQEKLSELITVVDDARNVAHIPEVNSREFDLILTDPPYSNMMTKKQSGEKRKKTGDDSPTPFTESDADIGNLELSDFLAELRGIIAQCLQFLKRRGYLVLFTKDFQPRDGEHNMLHAYITEELTKIPVLSFKGYKIWVDKTINLYPFGYPYAFVANQIHQYILVFRKE